MPTGVDRAGGKVWKEEELLEVGIGARSSLVELGLELMVVGQDEASGHGKGRGRAQQGKRARERGLG